MARTKKRFIAGATCEKCKAEDTLMLFVEDNKEHVECVQCGYKMSEPDSASAQSATKRPNADSVIGIFKP
ncbi:YheV family putative zinc ribbon protein [Aliidiomarina celeris]|uniref:YheV family putative zinc ribbon protein n=1 Tax=Aliidiomarina celeris TaxID=2249428 RepID=UPI000DE9E000|nr:YheV family putative zinc ribbon protein [Aliidiomarina celeris]